MAPPLTVRFGNRRHEVCNVPLTGDQIVVAPSLLGSPRDVTTFLDLRDKSQEAFRDARDDPTWSFDNLCCDGVRGGRVGELADASPALREAIQRIGQYFSMDEASRQASVAYHKGRSEFQFPNAPQ